MSIFPSKDKKEASSPAAGAVEAAFDHDRVFNSPQFNAYIRERRSINDESELLEGRRVDVTRGFSPEEIETEYKNFEARKKAVDMAPQFVKEQIRAIGHDLSEEQRIEVERWVERTALYSPEKLVQLVEGVEYSARLEKQIKEARETYETYVTYFFGGTQEHFEKLTAIYDGTPEQRRALLKKHVESENEKKEKEGKSGMGFFGRLKFVYLSDSVATLKALAAKELKLSERNLDLGYADAKLKSAEIGEAIGYRREVEQQTRGLVDNLERYRFEAVQETADATYTSIADICEAARTPSVATNAHKQQTEADAFIKKIRKAVSGLDTVEKSLDDIEVSDESREGMRRDLELHLERLRTVVSEKLKEDLKTAESLESLSAFRKTVQEKMKVAESLGVSAEAVRSRTIEVLRTRAAAETDILKRHIIERTIATL